MHQSIVLALAVIDLRVRNVGRTRLPARIGCHPLNAAVGVLDAQLGMKRGRRVAVVVGLLKPLERRLIPAWSQQRFD